MILRMV